MIRQRSSSLTKPLINLFRFITTESTQTQLATPSPSSSPVNPAHLLRVCTILYQQQNSPESRLHSNLNSSNFQLTHEFFLQVCNSFPLSWRPVYLFFLYTQTHPNFTHTTVSFNKMVDVIGKARNIQLLWDMLHEMGRRRFDPDIGAIEKMMETLFKTNRYGEALKVFQMMRVNRMDDLGLSTYRLVIERMCKRGKIEEAHVAGKSLEATKYVERVIKRGLEVPRFDYNKFLHYYSNEEGVEMFEEVGKKLREVGIFAPTRRSTISVWHGFQFIIVSYDK
ncbi:hypothetical protein GBA52_002817 [Prunus armeniaca]|nr:hypothetical protein GBA52_002817 [Prunus armeniaca]